MCRKCRKQDLFCKMIHAIYLALLVVSAAIVQINAQDRCVPLAVINLRLSPNGTLIWQQSPDDICVISYYVILVQYDFGEIEESYLTSDPWTDVSHLPPCDDWIFTVTPVSTQLMGGESYHLFTKTPMRPDTDLSLIITNATQTDEYLVLQWEVANASNAECADLYHVTVLDEEINEIKEEITSDKFEFIRDLAPCGRYQFSVSAIHRAIPESPGPLATLSYLEPPRSPAIPILEDITYRSTSFSSHWRPEAYAANRCNLTEVNIDGSPNFNITNFILDSSSREPFPVNVNSLRPNTLYMFRLSIRNTAGWSSPILLAAQTAASGYS